MSPRKARTMLRANDIVGLMALPPTPAGQDVDPFGTDSTVDLAEATNAVAARLIADGAKSIGLCGTTGECAAVTWSEKQEYYAAIKDTVAAGKVPLFAGATTSGTRDTVEQMRWFRDLGIDGAFVGLPLWQTPTLENAVGFYADLSAAVPGLPRAGLRQLVLLQVRLPGAVLGGHRRPGADDHRLQGRLPVHRGALRRRRKDR